jgi:hypothetical protein
MFKTRVINYPKKGEYGILQYYHTGVYDEDTKNVIFDTKYHWKKVKYEDFVNEKSKLNSSKFNYIGIIESQLNEYKKKRVSVDDNGTLLPFIIEYIEGYNYEIEKNTGVKILKDDMEHDTSLPFKIGDVLIVDNGDDTKTINEIISIGFYKTSNENDCVHCFSTKGDIVKYSDISKFNIDIDVAPFIGFKYISGKIVDSKNNVIEPGLIYEERYSYNKSKMENVEIDGKGGLTFNYIDVKFNESKVTIDNNRDINSISVNPLYTNVCVDYTMLSKSNETNYAPVYKDESLLGVSNVNSEINVNITRGISAAFERHQILGEVKTFQDLQNFRNNYFEI